MLMVVFIKIKFHLTFYNLINIKNFSFQISLSHICVFSELDYFSFPLLLDHFLIQVTNSKLFPIHSYNSFPFPFAPIQIHWLSGVSHFHRITQNYSITELQALEDTSRDQVQSLCQSRLARPGCKVRLCWFANLRHVEALDSKHSLHVCIIYLLILKSFAISKVNCQLPNRQMVNLRLADVESTHLRIYITEIICCRLVGIFIF